MNKATAQKIASQIAAASSYLERDQTKESINKLIDALTSIFDEILFEEYRSEFKTYEYEGTMHRDGLTFDEWVNEKIGPSKNRRIMKTAVYHPHTGGSFTYHALLPCPCCGGKPELIFQGDDYTKSKKVTIKCRSCRLQRTDAAMKQSSEWVAKIAINQWNKRA